jgi:hypothetical protein
MNWFYALNGQQNGPVSEDQLNDLVRTGAIDQDTLVWREGMAEWQALRFARGAAPPPPPPNFGVCTECGRHFPFGDMLMLNQSWVCASCKPIFLQRLREGSAPVGAAGLIWRKKKQFVMRPETPLPDRCVCCNAPANGFKLKRQLFWHPPAYFALILISILIYAIVAFIVRKKALVHIGLCEKHRTQRKWAIIVACIGFVLGIGLLVLGLSQESGWAIFASVILMIAALVVGGAKGGVVSAAKIDKEFVWVKGANETFLAEFPEWPEAR